MLLLSKHKHPLTAVILLALVASTALLWSRWSKGDDTLYLYLSERRGLTADQEQHVPDPDNVYARNYHSLVARNYQSLVAKGHDPNSVSFQRLMDRRIGRRMDTASTNQLKRVHIYARTFSGLAARGYDPNTQQFQQKLYQMLFGRKKGAREHPTVVRRKLKETENIWLRGNFIKAHSIRGLVWRSNEWRRGEEVKNAAVADEARKETHNNRKLEGGYEPLSICDRPADVSSVEDNAQCPKLTKDKPIILLEGVKVHGRFGNNLIEFLHAIQAARENNLQLGIMANAWPIPLITNKWFAIEDEDTWAAQFEEAFCVKIFPASIFYPAQEGWNVIHADPKKLLHYGTHTLAPLGEYKADQERDIRTLFRHINRGQGHDRGNEPVKDMCSGIISLFGEEEERSSAIYSVIHSRSFASEGNGKGHKPGPALMRYLWQRSGVDPLGALELRPDYIKSILEPLGMLDYPIAYITDGQDPQILERLMADPDIGPLIQMVPEEASWLGGEITLAVMSNVFNGNPASTFSSFIAKSRLALGFGHNYLFRAKDENDQWRTVCGDHCVFDPSIKGMQA